MTAQKSREAIMGYNIVLIEYVIYLAELGYNVEDVIYLLRLAGYNWC